MQDFDWNIILSLYQTKSISQSAEQLYLSQPALTKRLRNIERELNCNIVVRSHSGNAFTPQAAQTSHACAQRGCLSVHDPEGTGLWSFLR